MGNILGTIGAWNWGDVATWFSAVANLCLFVVAFRQIADERRARQEDQHQHEEQEKRDQAERVTCWIAAETYDDQCICVSNGSTLPIYNVVVNIVFFGEPSNPNLAFQGGTVPILVVPPGQGFVLTSARYHGMSSRAGAEIAFSDSFSRQWLRQSDGTLMQIQEPAIDYYRVPQPVDWQDLLNVIPAEFNPHSAAEP